MCDSGNCRLGENPASGVGGSNTGGNGGSSGGGGAPEGGSAGAPSEDCCLDAAVEWKWVNGLSAEPEYVHTLNSCGDYTRRLAGVTTVSCSNTLPACGGPLALDADALNAAIKHEDVQAARGAAPVSYGPIVEDGPVLDMIMDGSAYQIMVRPCLFPDDPCDVPAGILQLVELLDSIALQQLTIGDCQQDPICGMPLGEEPCEAAIQRVRFNAETHSCEEFVYGGCAEGENNFATLSECQVRCGNDPCSAGHAPLADDTCFVLAEGRCMANETQACICACDAAGNDPDSCTVIESLQPEAGCNP
jgi:hypothetical protein